MGSCRARCLNYYFSIYQWRNSAGLKIDIIFPTKKTRKFAWNVNACFLEKIIKIFQNLVCQNFYPECCVHCLVILTFRVASLYIVILTFRVVSLCIVSCMLKWGKDTLINQYIDTGMCGYGIYPVFHQIGLRELCKPRSVAMEWDIWSGCAPFAILLTFKVPFTTAADDIFI